MNGLVERAGLSGEIECDSAGTSGYHEGEPADARMIHHAKQRGYSLTSQSRAFREEEDFEKFDYILTMDQSNHKNVLRLDPKGQHHHKVMPMVKYCRIHQVEAVPDPYYQGENGFQLVLDILEDACAELLKTLLKELGEK